MRIAILTVSTAGARGERKDTSGDAIAAWALAHKHELVGRELVSDDVNAIVERVRRHHAAGADHVAIQAVTPDPARALEELQLLAPALLT